MNIIMSVLFPIIAYMGIPGDKSTDETFRDFKNAGFDICITNYFNINDGNVYDVNKKINIVN